MKKYTIIADSREQRPINFANTIVKGLKTGDYSIEGHEDSIAIERKSLGDIISTLSSGHKRFKNELQRALKLKYFAIVVEGSYTALIGRAFPGAEYTKVDTKTTAKILFTIHLKYGVPIFFTNGKRESKQVILELFDAYMRNQELTIS